MNDSPRQISQQPSEMVFSYLHSRPEGLSAEEAAERLAHIGRNSFEVSDRWQNFRRLARQFTNFFTLLLMVSAAICFGAHRLNPGEGMMILALALLGVALLNALFSFIQEYRAEKAMDALRKFLPQMVEVRRDGQPEKVMADLVVPGDVIVLAEGDKIPADIRVVESDGLMVDNAPLTGESVPTRLVSEAVDKLIEESENIAFAGCTVVRGTGQGVVFATGFFTEFGKVAHLSQTITRTSSPLEKETSHMVRILTIIACSMGFGFFLYGVVTGRPLWINLVFMMGIIVANVPEGLLPTFTLSLAMASLRMARKNVLVKGLNAVESLGAVHVICSDKTGTLTMNRLTITSVVEPISGADFEMKQESELLGLALGASEVRRSKDHFLGDPLDVAVALRYETRDGNIEELQENIVQYFTFDIEKRRSAGIVQRPTGMFFVVKGAFEAIRPMLGMIAGGAGNIPVPATAENLGKAEAVMRGLAVSGLRVIALAYGQIPAGSETEEPDGNALQDKLERGLLLAGFLGIEDPLRSEVPGAVQKCKTAGIDIILITGDHPETAMAVARNSGIVSGKVGEDHFLTGDQLKKLRVSGLVEKLEQGIRVFARTSPEQKMKIVTALQDMDKVVAMTGDGVNDAPALKAADVGIAMGRQGTDVARESAQIILLDDNFASIVAGIEEGRTVFENIRKFTNYVLVSNGPEILPYLLYVLLPVPLALNVIQILSIDLGTDIIPSMGLGQEPPDPEVMSKPPRGRSRGLLTPPLIIHSYLFLGLLEGLWSLFLFFYVLVDGGWQYGTELPGDSLLYRSATGIALSTILLMQIGNLVGRRYQRRSGLDRGLFTNKLLLAGIVIQVVFSWATLYSPLMNKVLQTGPVPLRFYLLAWLGIILIFGADYLRKKVADFLGR